MLVRPDVLDSRLVGCCSTKSTQQLRQSRTAIMRLPMVGISRPRTRPVGPSERVTGIEPALSAWEAEVLPLNYTRERLHSR